MTEDTFSRQSFLPPYISLVTIYLLVFVLFLLPYKKSQLSVRRRTETMKGSSKVIVGATLIMVVCLALVLGLVLVLLAELYCSLLLRRRQLRRTASSSKSNMATNSLPAATTTTTNQASHVYNRQHQEEHSVTPSLSSFYAHGVLHAPRSFLFPSVHVVNGKFDQDLEKQQQHSLRSLFGESQTHQLPSSSSSSHEFVGHEFSLPPSPTTFTPLASPPLVHEVPLHCSGNEVCGGSYTENNYIYICNPIYDNDGNMPIRVDTPFETPDSSPSRLEAMGSSGDDDDHDVSPSSSTPPLTPMKKLPAEGCSVSLRNARSLATSRSDSNNSNIYGISSSSSSGSPFTSPSW